MAACLALATLTGAGCGGGESSKPPPSASANAPTTAPAQTQTQTQIQKQPQTQPVYAEPRFDTEHGLAPNPWPEPAHWRLRPHPHYHVDRVVVREIKKGRGPAVRGHDMVFIDYIEADYARALKFNRAWRRGGQYPTVSMVLAPTGSRRGLLAGMKGMRPGGRRQIVAPPRLGGTFTNHPDWHNFVYWDVVLRKILARECSADGRRCRFMAP
jgi:hypothetical protein